MLLTNKVALVTGAGSGIGGGWALLFAREGARVVVADVNDAAGQAVVEELRAAGGEAVYVHADVSKSADAEGMVRAAEESFGRLDVLFNNAGISHARDDDAVATEEEVWDLTMSINLKGVFLGCKHGIPALRRAGGGSIINTASFVALLGAATPQLAYTASKGGVLAMTRELAVIPAPPSRWPVGRPRRRGSGWRWCSAPTGARTARPSSAPSATGWWRRSSIRATWWSRSRWATATAISTSWPNTA